MNENCCNFDITRSNEMDEDDDNPKKKRKSRLKKDAAHLLCTEKNECEVCGYCIRHCLQHTMLRPHIKTPFKAPYTSV